jgi:hypothetical protein
MAKPSIGAQGLFWWPGRNIPYGFSINYHRESGLVLTGRHSRLSRPAEIAIAALVNAGLVSAWADAQRLTDHVLPRGRLPGSNLAIGNLLIHPSLGSRPGSTLYVPSGRFALTIGLNSRAQGSMSLRVAADGRTSFAFIGPPAASASRHLSLFGHEMVATPALAARTLGTFLGDPAAGRQIVASAQSHGPALADFGRAVLTGLGQGSQQTG